MKISLCRGFVLGILLYLGGVWSLRTPSGCSSLIIHTLLMWFHNKTRVMVGWCQMLKKKSTVVFHIQQTKDLFLAAADRRQNALENFFQVRNPPQFCFLLLSGCFFFLCLQSMSSVIGLVQSVQPPGRHKKKNGIMTNPML